MVVSLYLAAGSSHCQAIHMTAKALGIEFNIVPMSFETGDLKTLEYAKINPMQTVPGFDDDGFRLTESRTIMTYMCSKQENQSLYPKDIKQRALVDNVLFFDVTSVYPGVAELVYPQILPNFPSEVGPGAEGNVRKALDRLDQIVLANSDYMAGDSVTLADLSVSTSVTMLECLPFDLSPWKRVASWLDRMRALPYYDECNRDALELRIKFRQMKAAK